MWENRKRKENEGKVKETLVKLAVKKGVPEAKIWYLPLFYSKNVRGGVKDLRQTI